MKNCKENLPSISLSFFTAVLFLGSFALTPAVLAADTSEENADAQVTTQPAPKKTLSSNTISVTASRVAEEIKETPVTISIIDSEEIETVKFVDSVTELLNRIPGNSLTRNLRIPMGGKNYTVNLVDGMAVRSFGRGTFGFIDEVNTFDIERVEVIKGPASSLYGSNALGGVINVITRDPPAEPEFRLWGEYGDFDRGRGGFSAAGSADSWGYFFDANKTKFDGSQDRTTLEREAVSGKLIYDFNMDTSASLRLEALNTSEQEPGSLTQAEYDENWLQAHVDTAYGDAQMRSATATFLTGIGENGELDIKYAIREHNSQGMPSYSATAAYSEDEMLNHNVVATYRHDFDFWRQRIIGGVDLQHSTVDEISFVGGDPDAIIDDTDSWEVVAKVQSPFVQYEVSPWEPLRFTLGARYDNVTYAARTFDDVMDEEKKFSNVTPKVGATLELNEDNSIWVGYNEGFVAPGRTMLFTGSRDTDPNPSLKPERAVNYEAGIRGRLFDGRFRYDVAYYDTIIEDMVVSEDGTGAGGNDLYVNAGEVEVSGVETSLAALPFDFLKLDMAYTYAKNQYNDYVTGTDDYSGNDLRASPLHHVNARATLMPVDGLDIELEWDHLSAYYTHDLNDSDPMGKYQRPDLYHLRTSYDVGGWSLWLHVLNLEDKKYAQRVSYSLPSRFSSGGRNYNSGSARTVYAGVMYTWK